MDNISISNNTERRTRAKKIVAYLRHTYPKPKTELKYNTSFQCIVAIVLSAQCTDKTVNKCTSSLFKKYKTVSDFAKVDQTILAKNISSISFFNNKAKNIIATAQIIHTTYKGRVPHTESKLMNLPGIGYKTAHVILGELFDIWNGIATDTHVRRFAIRFDLSDNTEPTKISKDLETLIPKKDWKYVNNGLVLYGRYVCPARPHICINHPLTKIWSPAAKRWLNGGVLILQKK